MVTADCHGQTALHQENSRPAVMNVAASRSLAGFMDIMVITDVIDFVHGPPQDVIPMRTIANYHELLSVSCFAE